MVDLYHRAVFSTTIHGYEGCGRGFSLKFQTWLKSQRPGTNFSHLEQPIRWATGDPLENWVFDTFLLNGELDIIENENRPKVLQRIEKVTLFENPQLLNSIFALLVNAHYQTTPNDLILLLGDETIHLYTMMQGEHCIGCVLTIEEGGLEGELAEQILLGKRRPKGELVASLLTNQLGLKQAATEQSLRVMRIAVHPELQGQGLGSTMLTQLVRDTSYDFYSTSFGATEELVNFWCSNGFKPLKLGSQRDQASGTHSLVMVKSDSDWLVQAQQRFVESLHYLLSDRFKNIETELVRSLLANDNASEANRALPRLVELYIGGSSNYDSIAFELYEWIKLNPNKLSQVSDLVIRKLMQKHTWQQCVEEYNLIGRKQAEQQFKVDLLALNN
jgi:tRNA(Met) cytidine acetyltransferase